VLELQKERQYLSVTYANERRKQREKHHVHSVVICRPKIPVFKMSLLY